MRGGIKTEICCNVTYSCHRWDLFLLYLPLTGNPFRGKDAGNIRWRRRKFRSVLSDGWTYRLGIQILNMPEKGYRKPCSYQAETLLRSE
jgi:hypothetical protein